MVLTFPYKKKPSSIFKQVFRPVAQVFLYSEAKKIWYEVWMIIDTGADYTLLPKHFSERLKIDLKKECQLFKTAGIDGEEKVYLKKNLKVEIGNWERTVPVGFLDKENIPPLLGRQGFLETFEVLFSSNHTVNFSIK
ncbi:MAG: retropepsin-like aspartic protease [Patescibacteria group bacterium]